MTVGYFINQHPKVSHSFIRREILALEALGLEVRRYALRGWDEPVVDPLDVAERERTRYVLRDGLVPLARALLTRAVNSPAAWLRGMAAAWRQWRGGDRSLAHNLISLAEACRLLEWMRADGITHVHAHFGTNSALVVMLARVLGGPGYSFTVHGPDEWDAPVALGLERKMARAEFVVGISNYTCAQLRRWAPAADGPRIARVHCGIDASFEQDPGPTPTATSRFVCVGRLCRAKAQPLLVEAVARLIREGVDAELVLAGDGELRGEVESTVRRLGIESKVRITGWISGEQVRAELSAARALVLPSFAEGLPVVLMEALALRRPVITTWVAGIPELVRDGQEGWLIAPGSVNAIEVALRSCLRATPEQLRRMGDSGRARALQRHSILPQARRLAELIEGVR